MKAILFDFGGTLDSNGIAWKERFYSIYRSVGIDPGQDKFDRAFYDSDDYLHINHDLANCGFEATVALQVDDVFKNLGINDREKSAAVKNAFVNGSRACFEKNRKVLDLLKGRYKMGIVSNFYGNMKKVLESEGLIGYFDAIADSTVVGHIKPDREIFFYALDRLGAGPEHAVMVGDSIKRDMLGADKNGIACALLWGDREGKPSFGFTPSRGVTLSGLQELPEKVEQLV